MQMHKAARRPPPAFLFLLGIQLSNSRTGNAASGTPDRHQTANTADCARSKKSFAVMSAHRVGGVNNVARGQQLIDATRQSRQHVSSTFFLDACNPFQNNENNVFQPPRAPVAGIRY